ncbi:MAG: ImmA/IrrE family metallo-endopeptidase [Anaerolineae bacterium]|nr:ImmA/IrrE family metallo-endopeptidase [Anaerolineae bacterium]
MKMQLYTEQAARQRIRDLVRCTQAAAGLTGVPPYTGGEHPIANHLGIVIKETSLPLGDEGQYIPGTPPCIVINPAIGDPERRNFTFFHEIAHHLLRTDDSLYSFLHEYAATDDQCFDTVIEQYCNMGAAEFLMPAVTIRELIDQRGFSIRLIEDLEPLCPASKPAIAIQLAHCATHQCFVVVCEWREPPRKPTPQTAFISSTPQRPQLYVLYAARSPSTKYAIGRFVPVPSDHVIALAYETQCMVKDVAPILFRNGNREWKCECEAFYYKGKVYAVFNVSSPIPPGQLGLF